MGALNKITTIQKKNIVEEIYQQMIEHIRQGLWKPGDKIPSENELCKMFSVSRISVRSAIQKLRAVGMIDTRHGQGSYIARISPENVINPLIPLTNISEKELLDMMEFRETIEFKCIDLAVERADEEDINEIETALKKVIQTKHDTNKCAIADYEFHLAIAKASKNYVLYTVMKNTRNFFYNYLHELNCVFGIDGNFVQGHIDQFEALKRRDAERVKQLIKNGMDQTILAIRELERQKK